MEIFKLKLKCKWPKKHWKLNSIQSESENAIHSMTVADSSRSLASFTLSSPSPPFWRVTPSDESSNIMSSSFHSEKYYLDTFTLESSISYQMVALHQSAKLYGDWYTQMSKTSSGWRGGPMIQRALETLPAGDFEHWTQRKVSNVNHKLIPRL